MTEEEYKEKITSLEEKIAELQAYKNKDDVSKILNSLEDSAYYRFRDSKCAIFYFKFTKDCVYSNSLTVDAVMEYLTLSEISWHLYSGLEIDFKNLKNMEITKISKEEFSEKLNEMRQFLDRLS